MEFIYTQGIDSDEPIMLIDKHIGFDEEDGVGIMGSQFQKELLFLDTLKKKRIQIWINSPGGIVMDGYDICNAIMRTKTKVDTYCYGIAASIAGVIFMAGRTRYMTDYGLLMMHNPYNSEGTQSEELEKIKQSIVTIISKRSGLTDKDVVDLMNKTSWIEAEEAERLGLCHVVEESNDMNSPRIKKTDDVKAMWKEGQKVLNKVKNLNEKPLTMKKVANKLGLNAEASEDSILDAVNSMEEKMKASDEDKKKVQEEMDKLKQKMSEDASKLKQMEDDMAKMKAEKDGEDAKAKAKSLEDAKAKAKDLVAGAVKNKKIVNDAKVIESWEDKATEDFEGTKAMIESITLNKKAPSISTELKNKAEVIDGVPAITPDNTASYVMAMNAKNLAKTKVR